jgi:hypothetical protein
MIIPDRYFVTVQLPEARERAEGVEIIVENRDFHPSTNLS